MALLFFTSESCWMGVRHMDKPRPYITAALLCEKVLQEKDESVTLMRIIDKLQDRVEGLPMGVHPAVAIQGFLSLKSGSVTGEHTVKVVVERPNGDRKEVFEYPTNFLGKDQGQSIILQMGLGITLDGLYWFDVLFDEEVLTRIPLMVIPMPAPEPALAQT
jgi:hypothetical protein